MRPRDRLATRLAVFAALAASVVGLAVFRSALAAAAASPCADVTGWSIDLPATASYFFVKSGGGWVSSHSANGADPFGTVSLSVSGDSFHASNPYNASYGGYSATFEGTLSSDCTIGQATPDGTWKSNHGSTGIFLADPTSRTAAPGSPHPCTQNATRALSAATGTAAQAEGACAKQCDPKAGSTYHMTIAGIGSFDPVSFSLGEGTSVTGPGTHRVASSTLTFVKVIDPSSTGIRTALASGKQLAQVSLEVFRACATTPELTYTLQDVSISAAQTLNSPASGGAPRESVTLDFQSATVITSRSSSAPTP